MESKRRGVILYCLEMVLKMVLDTYTRGCGSSGQGRPEVIKHDSGPEATLCVCGAELRRQEASRGVVMRTHSHSGTEEPGLGGVCSLELKE